MLKPIALLAILGASAAQAACPVLDSRGWSVDLVAGAGETQTLILRGILDMPSPGYRIAWHQGPMDRALPPGWRLSIEATPPDGMAAQVITPVHVEAHIDTPINRFRVIYIACGDDILADMKDVALTD